MRTTQSIKNSFSAIILNIVTILFGMITQTIFIHYLGKEYLGLNSLFSNIIYIFNLVELGFGTAIIYNMYKPVSEKNIEKIKSLLAYYKRIYHVIAIIVLLLGICILPFLSKIVGKTTIQDNIYIIFILFLLDSVFSYLLTYKRSILYATQNSYVINTIHSLYTVFMNTFCILCLIMIHNYYVYLIIKIIFRIIENLFINHYASKKYPYIDEKEIKELDDSTKGVIKTKIRALFFHKVGEVMLLGTDSIIISKFLGIVWVGLYSNYNMIINAISGFFGQIFSSMTASVGNLLVEEKKEKIFSVYKRIIIFNFWFSSFCTIAIFCLATPFIDLWLGREFILSTPTTLMLALVFYMQTMKKTLKLFKESAGKFEKDKFVPLIESTVNIVFSILFVKLFGLIGVFIGTFLSTLVLYAYSFPFLVYKDIFKKNYLEYLKEYISYMILMLMTLTITYFVTTLVTFESKLINLLVRAVICFIIPNLVYYIIYRKKDEFRYYQNLIKKLLKRSKEK